MSTAIERSWTKTIVWSAVGLVFAGSGGALGIWAATGEDLRFIAWLPAAVLLMLAVPCFAVARSRAGHAACPECGASVHADAADLRRAVQCPTCSAYARVVDGRLEGLPEDWVDAEARFTAQVPKEPIQWPGCAMCGAPPTRARVHEHVLPETAQNLVVGAVGMATAGVLVTSDRVYRLSVPYCDAHDDCVELDVESGALVIRFRSLPVFEAFRSAN